MDTQIVEEPTAEQINEAVSMFKLLADETRLRLLWALLHGEHSVGELADHVGAQPAGVSQHLAKLRLSRMVRTRRDGNRVLYAAENDHVLELIQQSLFHADHLVTGTSKHAVSHGARHRPGSKTVA